MKKLLLAVLLLPALAKSQTIPTTPDSASRYITNQFGRGATWVFTKAAPSDSLNRLQVAFKSVLGLIGQGGSGSDPLKLNISDTSSMLSAYRAGLNARLLYADTAAMMQAYANAISLRMMLSDTSSMLSAYRSAIGLRATQSALQDTAFAIRSAIASGGGDITIDPVPTDGSANAVASNGVYDADQLRLLKSDTASMLAAYGNKINTKIGVSDTSAVLAPYQTALNGRVRYSDTASILAPYATKINTKYGSADTSALFTNYRNAINARVRYTDTASMLLPYANKINTKIGAADTASMLAAYQAALNEVVDIPIDEFPTLGSTNPATSGGIRTKLDSIVANMGTSGEVLATGLYTAMSGVTVPAGIDIVQTSGYGAIGRGAARYARTATAGAATWKFQSADGQWWELAEPVLNIDMFGAVGDGVTDNTTAIQSAIDYAAAGTTGRRNGQGTAVMVTNGLYVANQLYMKSGTLLLGASRDGKGGYSAGSSSGGAFKQGSSIPADSAMFTSIAGQYGWALNGLQIMGNGSSSTAKGIRVYDGRDFMITNNNIVGWGQEAIHAHGNPYFILHNMAQGLNNRAYVVAKGIPTGAVRLSGVDATVRNNEFTGSANFAGSTDFQVSGAELYLAAAHFSGLELGKFFQNIYQVADAGLNHPGNNNTFISERFDTNAGHGIFLGYGGSNNRFYGAMIERNSLAGTGQYDGIHQVSSTGGGNYFYDPMFYAGAPVGATTYHMRYFINDTKTDYAHNFVNTYHDPIGKTSPATDFYLFPADTEAGMQINEGGIFRLALNSATPSVLHKRVVRAYNSTFTTITNFTKAVPGQRLIVLGNNTNGAHTRLEHGANIKLRKGSGYDTLSMDIPREFINRGTYLNNIWVEITGDVNSGGTSGSVEWANILNKPTDWAGLGIASVPATALPAAGSSAAGILTADQFSVLFDKNVVAAWNAGTVTINMLDAQYEITISTTGARTLTFTNESPERKVAMYINNTSGADITLTLPAASFLQSPTTGVYTSATSLVIPQGRTKLVLDNYRSSGSEYWFIY